MPTPTSQYGYPKRLYAALLLELYILQYLYYSQKVPEILRTDLLRRLLNPEKDKLIMKAYNVVKL